MDNSWIDILITTWSGVLLGVAIAENMGWLGAGWLTGSVRSPHYGFASVSNCLEKR